MAGSITVTTSDAGRGITKYSIAWVCSAGGAVDTNTFNVKAGEIIQAGFIPDGGGTQPSDLYDVTMLDANSRDVLEGEGANLSNATATAKTPKVNSLFRRFVEAGALTPTVANAGNAKGGTIVLLIG